MERVSVNQHTLKFVMALIDNLELIELKTKHLNAALELSKEANWNQVGSDWEMMVEAGNAFGVVSPENHLGATAIALPFGQEFGWISMVLVTKAWRNKGIATHLLNHCVEFLEASDLIPVLDATPAGENVYRPLGFVPHYGIQRWEIDNIESSSYLRSYHNQDHSLLSSVRLPEFDEILELDRCVFGGDRRVILEGIFKRCKEFVAAPAAKGAGFLLGRAGRNAYQIGPVFAENSDLSVGMLAKALSGLSGRVFIDVLDDKELFLEFLKKIGFRSQRPFLRMAKFRQSPFGLPSKIFAIAGPELG